MMTSTREVTHETVVTASPGQVFALLADVRNWPRLFPPTVHVEWLEGTATRERVRFWATVDGELRTWTSLRTLDPAARRITFRDETPAHPVAELGGAWHVEERADGTCAVRLEHDFRPLDDGPAELARVSRAVDVRSRAELAALRLTLESASAPELTAGFAHSLRIRGQVREVYEFVRRSELWPERLPHVLSATLTEPLPGVQSLTTETRLRDGSVRTTHSYRVCLGPDTIAYKQTVLPDGLAHHTGRWHFGQDGEEVVATVHHTVVFDDGALPPGLTPPEARERVRRDLGDHGLTTLHRAKAQVEGR
ncbi:aromatase [Crossiella equi]|uniref:Aromatase n=1 Tax=Crossiella equi TaxID=130796 RepID=A0ABS5A726_9PSEU|nr:SRPBCC family protein [Crossiella equi]MBP2472402.1 aromatase [Crossiella equi]